MTMSDKRGAESGTPVRDAACLVLIDRSGPEPVLLMGRRLPTQIFLPNKWVFPGGRVDDADYVQARAEAARLNGRFGTNAYDVAHMPFVMAAVRETFEEAGLAVNASETHAAPAGLIPLARAITPPGLPRRFDTWFYIAEWHRSRAPTGTPDGELLDLGWFTLPEIRALDLPLITRLIVDDVAIAANASSETSPAQVPFYYQALDEYRRTLISPFAPWPEPGPQP
ncbi:MAG: NUDIX hydrolase [Hyphomicrobium sp.]|nr:NUDIX hydrolase [Hyphomicrobium sp.]